MKEVSVLLLDLCVSDYPMAPTVFYSREAFDLQVKEPFEHA
jgi:hypothetical protein